ncbi:MAG: WD40 repeat domain-containing protein [Myxococcota bacterium]
MPASIFDRVVRPTFKRVVTAEHRCSDHILGLLYAPKGDRLVVVPTTGAPELWSGAQGQVRLRLEGHGGDVLAASWSPDGEYVVTGGQDGTARVWQAATGGCVAVLSMGQGWVEQVAYAPTGAYIAVSCGKRLSLFQPNGVRVQVFEPQASTIMGLQWLFNGKLVGCCAYGGVSFFHPGGAEALSGFAWKGSLIALAWSPRGDYLVAGCQDGALHAWRTENGEDFEMSGYRTKVRELSWDSAGRFLASGGGLYPVIWDFSGEGPAGRSPLELRLHTTLLSALSFRPGRTWLLVGAQEGGLSMWDLSKPRQPLLCEALGASVTQVSWHAQGMQFAVGLSDGHVQLCTWR